MGDVARSLDGKNEVIRRRVPPSRKGVRPLQTIKGAIDLDRGKLPRGVGKLLLLEETLGIESTAPWRICPAGDAGADFACFCHLTATADRALCSGSLQTKTAPFPALPERMIRSRDYLEAGFRESMID
jgi:hypothetical protein